MQTWLQVSDKGDGFQYIALATKDLFKTAEALKRAGAPIVQDIGYLPGTGISSIVTQCPSGWKFAFINVEDYFRDIASRCQVE